MQNKSLGINIATALGITLIFTIPLVMYKEAKYIEAVQKELRVQQFKEKEKQCIATAIYHEARGEGEFGMKAVANVIYNRYNNPNYPDTYCGVVNQYKQFSYTLENKPEGEILKSSLMRYDRNKQAYDKAEEIAEQLIEDKFNSFLPENVLHYTTVKVKNYWTKTKKVLVQIGSHKFYTE